MTEIEWKPNHTFALNTNGEQEVAVLSYVTVNLKYTYTLTEQKDNYLLTCNDKDWEEMLPPITFKNEKEAFSFVDFLERLTPFPKNSGNVTIAEALHNPFMKELIGQIAKHERVLFVETDTVAHVWAVAGGSGV